MATGCNGQASATPVMIELKRGNHAFQEGGCLMEIVALLNGRRMFRAGTLDPHWDWPDKRDVPACTSLCVAYAAQRVNDALGDRERKQLALLIPRILRARRHKDPKVEHRILLRVTLWAAERCEHLLDPEVVDRFHAALEKSRSTLWLDDVELDDNHWQPGWIGACHAAASAPINAYTSLGGAIMTLEYGRQDNLVMFLDELIDAWEKASAEEGALTYDPEADYPPDDEVNAVINAIMQPG